MKEVWIDDDDVVVNAKAFEYAIKYKEYVENNYPEIHKIVVNAIVDLKDMIN